MPRTICLTTLLRSTAIATALSAALLACSSLQAYEVVAVEEHWELKIGQPSEATSGPQITMVMSPTYDLTADYFLLTVNHHLTSDFSPGGLQLQHWYNDSLEYARLGPQEGRLRYENETVSWVQRMTLEAGALTFEIIDGSSESWGSFGGAGHLRISIPGSYENLNNYHPAVSLLDSGVNYGGNRVSSLTLRLLRWWDSEGNVYEYEAPIDVDADIDP